MQSLADFLGKAAALLENMQGTLLLPFLRDEKTLARNWAIPGTPDLEHRIGGIERDYNTGNISYQPDNHDRMTRVRANKIKGIANDIPPQEVGIGKGQGRIHPQAYPGWRGFGQACKG